MTTCDYSDKKVSGKALLSILEAARWAPSSLNLQPWRFIVVKNRQAIKALLESAYYGLFHTPPAAIICIAVPREFNDAKKHRGAMKGKLGYDEAMLNAGMPSILMALAAQDMGLSTCILTLDEKKIAKLLGMRTGDRVPIAVGIGHKAGGKQCSGFTHERHPLHNLVDYEKLNIQKVETDG